MKKLKKTLMSASLVLMATVMGFMMTACGKGGNGGLGININIPTPESLGTEIDQTQAAEFLSSTTLDNWTGINAKMEVVAKENADLLYEVRMEMKVFDDTEMLMVLNGYGRDAVGDAFETMSLGGFANATHTYANMNMPGLSMQYQTVGNELLTDEDMKSILEIWTLAEDITTYLNEYDAFYLNSAETVLTLISDNQDEYEITILHFDAEKELVKIESYHTGIEEGADMMGYAVLENQATSFADNLPSMFNGKEGWANFSDLK